VSEPDSAGAWGELLKLYRQQNRVDFAGEAYDHLLPLLEERLIDSDNPQIQAYLSEQQGLRRDSRDMIRDNQKRLDEYLETQVTSEDEEDRISQLVALATEVNNGGFGAASLKLLDDMQDKVNRNPAGAVLRCQLMLEAGRLEEAHQALAMMAELARQQPQMMTGAEWQFPTALSQLAISDLTSAWEIWSSQLKELDAVTSMSEPYMGSLLSLPMVADANIMVNSPVPVWPMQHLDTLSMGMEILPASRAEILFLLAMIRLEEANLKSAQSLLETAITSGGESVYRGIAIAYLAMLNEQAEVFLTEHMVSDYEAYEFPGEPDPPPAEPNAPAAPSAPRQ
jgi:hypothetical protein